MVPIWDAKYDEKAIFITCCADKSITVWRNDKVMKKINNVHQDVVRSLMLI